MNREAREQRIARLLIELKDLLLDIAFIEGRIKALQGPGKIHYENEKRKETAKLEKVRSELERLKAVH